MCVCVCKYVCVCVWDELLHVATEPELMPFRSFQKKPKTKSKSNKTTKKEHYQLRDNINAIEEPLAREYDKKVFWTLEIIPFQIPGQKVWNQQLKMNSLIVWYRIAVVHQTVWFITTYGNSIYPIDAASKQSRSNFWYRYLQLNINTLVYYKLKYTII